MNNTSGEKISQRWGMRMAGVCALLVLFAWLFWHFLASQFRFAIFFQADWGHTLVIPFIAGYFAWRITLRYARAANAPKPLFRTAWLGLLPLIAGIGVYVACTAGPVTLRHHNFIGVGVALAITGLTLLFVGWRALWWLWFPLAYLFIFGQTISESLLNRVTYFMQDITARGAGFVLSLFLDIDRLGNTLYIWQNGASIPLNIAEACSGMRMLMAFLALGTAMAYTGLKRPWQRVLLVLAAVPTAIFVNILRVCTLGYLSLIDSGLAAGDFHSFVGLVWLLPAFLIFLGLMVIIRHSVIEPPAASAATLSASRQSHIDWPFDRRAPLALLVACVTLLVCGAGFRAGVASLNIYLRKEAVPPREPFSTISRTLGPWRAVGEDAVYDVAMIEALGTSNFLDRRYAPEGQQERGLLQVHIAYYTGMIDAVPHIPERCFLAAGFEQQSLSDVLPLRVDRSAWAVDPGPPNVASNTHYLAALREDPFTGALSRVRMPVGDLEMTVMQFGRKDWPGANIFGGYLFIANGRATARAEAVRMLAFKPDERAAYYCKLQFVYAAPGATREQYVALVSDFLTHALPEIMVCLPDWQTVERQMVSGPAGSSP
jgi:exosortase